MFLLAAMAGCDADSVTPTPGPDPSPAPRHLDGLWTVSGNTATLVHITASQLNVSGDYQPATAITTTSGGLHTLAGVAFDTNGDLWVTLGDDSRLLGFAAAALDGSGSKAAASVISPTGGSLSAPTGLAFDPAGRLWVANHDNGTLVRFDRDQLAAGGALAPVVVISGAGHPTALGFDREGSLWVSDNVASNLAKYRAAQLAASGSPAPAVVLTSDGSSLQNPSGVAFDASGNLWVANIGRRIVVAFRSAQMAVTGSPAPEVVLSSVEGSLGLPVGLAFDSEGNLWVVNGSGTLTKLARADLVVTGAPVPSARLTITGHSLFWSAAFWPRTAGLPPAPSP